MANTKITSGVIADDAITTDKIAADSITGAKIADDAINSEHYTDGSIDTVHIADANITTVKIADDAITTAKIADDVALGGNPTTTTQSAGNNTTRIATTAFVTTAVSGASATLTGIDDQSSSNDDQITITDTAVIINEDSDDVDFRVEGNGEANLLFVKADNDRVGIGTNSPTNTFQVEGTFAVRTSSSSVFNDSSNAENVRMQDAGVTFNADGVDKNFTVQSDNDTAMFFVDGGNDRIGIGTDGPVADVELRRSQSSASKLLVRNTSSDNAADAAVGFLTQGNVDFTIGIDQSAGSHFKISKHETLGNNDALTINTSGHVNKPLQPAFDAGRNAGYQADDNNFIQDQVRTNVGSHYDSSNGRFTAPVAGQYLFSFRIFTHDSGGVVQAEVKLKKNGSDHHIFRAHKVGGYHTPVQGTKVITLAANDYVNTYVGDSGTSSGWMGSAGEYNYFSGVLLS